MSQATAVRDIGDRSRSLESIVRILRGSVTAGASDIHLRAGAPPMVRIEGRLCPLEHPPLDVAMLQAAVEALSRHAGVTVTPPQADFSCEVPQVGRFRAHAYWERGGPAMVLRCIPAQIPDFAQLRLPPVIKRIAAVERGLVLVCGATGNGKSTTIASMLQYLNGQATKHIVTVEDPIEFVFEHDRCSFSQREIGRDVDSVHQGLKGAMREDPDVIFIGEIRTPEQLEGALSAAESGRVVISTFHSSDAVRGIQRMIHMFPSNLQEGACHRIADILAAIVCQRLVPMRGSRQRVLVTEILVKMPTVQDCIRDATRLRGIQQALERGAHEYGSHTFDQELLRMVRDGVIAPDTAKSVANSPNDLMRALKVTR